MATSYSGTLYEMSSLLTVYGRELQGVTPRMYGDEFIAEELLACSRLLEQLADRIERGERLW